MTDQLQTELIKEIKKLINKNEQNRISFYEFMNMALYFPELGYYTKDRRKIGKSADFYTSSSVGPIFGRTIAKHFLSLFKYIDTDNLSILEMGGGDGRFARDVLDEIKSANNEIYNNLTYYMIEMSQYHRQLQSEHLKQHLDHVIWLNDLREIPSSYKGIVFSNELIDAFPVHKVKMVNGELQEVYIIWDETEESFIEVTGQLTNSDIEQYFIKQQITLKEGQIAEVNLDALSWIKSVNDVLEKGYVLTIDYGYPAEELYASHRHEGSIMCYYQHVANDNPYQNIGDQDITSHVNFTFLMQEGKRLGLDTVWFTTQSYFLINNGILNELTEIGFDKSAEKDLFSDQALKLNRAIRQLVMPGEMGETFKVLLQQKGISEKNYPFLKNAWEI